MLHLTFPSRQISFFFAKHWTNSNAMLAVDFEHWAALPIQLIMCSLTMVIIIDVNIDASLGWFVVSRHPILLCHPESVQPASWTRPIQELMSSGGEPSGPSGFNREKCARHHQVLHFGPRHGGRHLQGMSTAFVLSPRISSYFPFCFPPITRVPRSALTELIH